MLAKLPTVSPRFHETRCSMEVQHEDNSGGQKSVCSAIFTAMDHLRRHMRVTEQIAGRLSCSVASSHG
jgi:hypothetical protein